MLRKVAENEGSGIWKYKSSITKIVFQNEIKDVLNSKMSFDISEDQNDSVRAHLVPSATDTSTYTAYIQGDGSIAANRDSSFLFYGFTDLESIEGMEYFDTANVEKMSFMFKWVYFVNTTITIRNSSCIYDSIFFDAATRDSAKIIVNYTSNSSSLVDAMIATKSLASNVVKGALVSLAPFLFPKKIVIFYF